MNKATYSIWLCDTRGFRIALLDRVSQFTLIRTANNVGAFKIELPGNFDTSMFGVDPIVDVWRWPEGGGSQRGYNHRVFTGFVRKYEYYEINGQNYVAVGGSDTMDLLNRRIIAYYAGSGECSKTDYADDMLKEMVGENLGSGANDYSGSGTARDISGYGFTIQADTSSAPSITKDFAWRNLLTACQDVALASEENGTPLYFDVQAVPGSGDYIDFVFTTSINQLGIDRTQTSYNPLFFGQKFGNVTNSHLTYDYSEEVNYVYAGGQGEESGRNIQERYDYARVYASIWNRREGFADARNSETDAGVQSAGDEMLTELKPRITYQADIIDTPQARYGIHWLYGDKIECEYLDRSFSGMIKTLQVAMDKTGKERITARIEVDE